MAIDTFLDTKERKANDFRTAQKSPFRGHLSVNSIKRVWLSQSSKYLEFLVDLETFNVPYVAVVSLISKAGAHLRWIGAHMY